MKELNYLRVPKPVHCNNGETCETDPSSQPPMVVCLHSGCDKDVPLCPDCSDVTCSEHLRLYLQGKSRNTLFDIIRLRRCFQTGGGVAEFLQSERREMQQNGFAEIDSILYFDPSKEMARVVWRPETMAVKHLSKGTRNEIWLAYHSLKNVSCPFQRCNWRYSYAPDWLDHLASAHSRLMVLSCKKCDKVKGKHTTYLSWQMLEQHMMFEHNEGNRIERNFWQKRVADVLNGLKDDTACVPKKLECLAVDSKKPEVYEVKESLTTQQYLDGHD